MYTIATLDDLRRRLGLAATDSDSDQELLHSLQEASCLIESLTQRRYCPLLQRRAVTFDRNAPRTLILPADLLELRAISDAGGALGLEDVQLLPADVDASASILQLTGGLTFRSDASADRAIAIDGVWGWHDRWTRAWTDSGETINGSALSAKAATISVSDAAGSDTAGFSPRFQVGHLLRIEDEYLRITAIDRQNHQLTVQRGAQGTISVMHPQGALIETYTAALPIRDLTVRYAELMLKSHSLLEDEPSTLVNRMRRLTA